MYLEVEERKWNRENAESDEEQIGRVVGVRDVFVERIDAIVVHVDGRPIVVEEGELVLVAGAEDDQVDVAQMRPVHQ